MNSLFHPNILTERKLMLMSIRLGNGVLFFSVLILLDFLATSYETHWFLGFYDTALLLFLFFGGRVLYTLALVTGLRLALSF